MIRVGVTDATGKLLVPELEVQLYPETPGSTPKPIVGGRRFERAPSSAEQPEIMSYHRWVSMPEGSTIGRRLLKGGGAASLF